VAGYIFLLRRIEPILEPERLSFASAKE
jgi:hypothetical protein